MRLGHGLALLGALTLFGCGGGGGNGDDGDDSQVDAIAPPANGFQIVTPDITIPAGGEETYCYYTTVTMEQAAGIKRWSSVMTPGSHHLIVFFTDSPQQPDGTVTPNCGFLGGGGGLNLPIWTYSAATPEAEMAMPAGVGQQMKATQNLFVQMHYLNTNPNEALDVHVTLNAETYAPEEDYTPAAAYVTYSNDITIDGPAGTPGESEHTCAVPAGATFFTIGTHSHRRSVDTYIYDGTTEIYHSDSWEHPQDLQNRIDAWGQEPFYQFSGSLKYHCDYINDLDQQVTSGDSAATDEMCMAVGYYFPATTATFCIDGFSL